jgi:predicted transcriptional regulator
MLAALEEYGEDYPVKLAMRRQFPVAEPAEMLEAIFQRLRECGCGTMPVLQNGRLIGLITLDNLGEYLLIEATLQKRGHPGPANRNSSARALVWQASSHGGELL